ncbi:hypothetical protein ABEG18_13945 [Alsobacter sp. KACC 23698]|uniref:Sulfur globule protein n=1 Tax=Alsobacter sp. KACC 23698 TaxID=3149229 RepID=A0AAU7J9L9_9HYPH
MVTTTKTLVLAASALAAVAAFTLPAEAAWRGGGAGFRPGGFHGGAWRGGGWGYRGGGWGYRGGYWRGGGWGAPVAAGLVGGLALGALAAPAYGYGYGYPGYGYGYAPAYVGGYGTCYIERQRVYDAWGRMFIRRVRVCD